MQSTVFTIILAVLVARSCEQQQQEQQQNKQVKYHNISIMQNVIDSDMPLALQNSIAACCSIIREYFVPNANSFMLSTNVQELYLKSHMRDFLNSVLLNLSMIKVEIESKNSVVRDQTLNRKYNLIVIDGIESLRQLDPANFTKNYDIQESYLLYLMHASRFANVSGVLNEIFAYFWQNSIVNVSLMKVNNLVVEVFTYFPFDNYLACKVPLVKQINSYNDYWQESISFTIFPAKLTNIKNCALTVAVWDTPPYLSFVQNDEGSHEIDYFEAVLLKVLADKLNFTLDLKEPPNNEQRGMVLSNGSLTGAMKMLHDHKADLSLGSFRYTLERSEVLTAALPYYQTFQIYGVLTTAQLYTSLETLMYPFDNLTWICLFLSVQLGLFTAFIIHYFYDKSLLIQIAIGFPTINTPMVNVFRLFLGQSLIQIPETNFSRFMIISFHVYALLLRTAYQSLLFQLLKLNLYHEPPKSLTDLIDQRCVLVMTEGTFDSVRTVPRIEQDFIDVIKIKNTSEQSSFFFLEFNQEMRCLAAVSPKDFLTYHVIKERKRGMFYVLPESIFTQHITMFFPKHSYLINRFNELLMNLRSMGLIDFWAKKSLDTTYLDSTHESLFKPISISNLEGILMIYSVLILTCLAVFLSEVFIFKFAIRNGFGVQRQFIN